MMTITFTKIVSAVALCAAMIALPIDQALAEQVGKRNAKAPANAGISEAQWYVSNRVAVRDPVTGDTYKGDNPAIFGRLDDASDGYDRHDVRPYQPTSNAAAAVVFLRSDLGDQSGEFLSDYRQSKRQSNSWLMTVNSKFSNADVVLRWDDVVAVTVEEVNGRRDFRQARVPGSRTMQRLQLIDLQTLEVIPATTDGQLNHYAFNMNGQNTRQFRWVLGPVNASYFSPGSGDFQLLKSIQREADLITDAQETRSKSVTRGHPKFGLPPG
jgi:hypothetical protein